MKIIYANIVWFSLLIIGITIANLGRFNSEEWDDMSGFRFNHTLLYGGVSLLLVFSIAGLLLKRKWGYELALASNSTMALLPISLFVASFILLPELSALELIAIHATNLVVGVVSLVFWLSQVRSGVKAE
jgi:hypothetical protein